MTRIADSLRSRISASSRWRVLALWALAPTALVAQGTHSTAAAPAFDAKNLDHPMVVQYDARVRMPDGVHLSVDVFRPTDGERHPTVFTLTPYNNDSESTMDEAWRFVRRGYAYVAGDVRGRYDSEGEFAPFRHDGPDGSAVMDWIAQQPWSNGEVATLGASYVGMNQWLMARENNPHHKAIVSYVAPADGFNDLTRYNGVPKLDLIFTWSMGMDGRVNQSRGGWNWNRAMRGLPLNTLDAAVGRDVSWWRRDMEHDRLDEHWTPVQMTGFYDRFDIPSFNVTGWYEGQLKGQIKNYEQAVRTGRNAGDHLLVIGPWLHSVNRDRVIGERDAGPEAIIDLNAVRDAWMDHRMLKAPRPAEEAGFLYFLPVKNEWRAAPRYPIPGTEYRKYFLESQGRANTLLGNGRLRTDGPGTGRPDTYTYDPAQPVPSLSSRTAGARGGLPQGSVDHRAVETREDVLVYTSEALAEPMEITGPVKATLYLSTDVEDTDVVVRVLDVYPDGRAHNLAEGIARAKYRNGYEKPEALEAGKVYPIEVEFFPTSNLFEAGHRIRLEITSSDFPNFARNLNTMNSDTGTQMRVARTRIHHSREHPSHVVLPVVPAGATRRWTPPMR